MDSDVRPPEISHPVDGKYCVYVTDMCDILNLSFLCYKWNLLQGVSAPSIDDIGGLSIAQWWL